MKQNRSQKLVIGIVLLASFAAVLVAIFLPLFDGENALNFLDNLYNSISKGSAYYIPKVQGEVEAHGAAEISLAVELATEQLAAQAADLLARAGASAAASGRSLRVEGDLRRILAASLTDADDAYHGRAVEIEQRTGLAPPQALHTWWSVLQAIERELTREKRFADARVIDSVQGKALECAYNYYGIEASQISERWGIVVLSLVFYVVYTIWYGYGILFLFEGLGLQLSH